MRSNEVLIAYLGQRLVGAIVINAEEIILLSWIKQQATQILLSSTIVAYVHNTSRQK